MGVHNVKLAAWLWSTAGTCTPRASPSLILPSYASPPAKDEAKTDQQTESQIHHRDIDLSIDATE